jgi:hypothetical protein
MKIVYLAHPISGDVEANLEDLRRIVRNINLEHPDIVPFVPYYADIVSLNDNDPDERSRGIRNDFEIIDRGIPDELWLTGTKISFGMALEKDSAEKKGIPVVDMLNKL